MAALLLPFAVAAQESKPFNWADIIGPAVSQLIEQNTAFYSAEEVYRRGKDVGALLYVAGVVDADASSAAKQAYCIPNGASSGQVLDVVRKYMEENPKDRHHGAPYMVRRALVVAWPCVSR